MNATKKNRIVPKSVPIPINRRVPLDLPEPVRELADLLAAIAAKQLKTCNQTPQTGNGR